MISNLWLLFLVIAKASLMCGLAPGLAICGFFGVRGAKFFCPLRIGKQYRIVGYHTGDFIGEVISVDRSFARVLVTDPLRRRARVRNPCAFPECVREDFHGGDHELVRIRVDALIEVAWESAAWIPIEQSSARERLASAQRKRLSADLAESWASSSPRKARTA